MADSTAKRIVEFIEQQLRMNGLRSSKIIVFGSYGKDRAFEDSDIDIAIISDDFEGKDLFERVKMVRIPEIETLRKFMIPLDLVMLTCDEFDQGKSMIALYAKEGQVLFAA